MYVDVCVITICYCPSYFTCNRIDCSKSATQRREYHQCFFVAGKVRAVLYDDQNNLVIVIKN